MISENIMARVAMLPNEIQYKIMSYSISPQSPLLCEDIRDYSTTLIQIYKCYYSFYIENSPEEEPEDKIWLINDIYSYINDYYPICLGYRQHFYEIIRRAFIFRDLSDRKIENILDTYFTGLVDNNNINREINSIWGLLRPEERDHFTHFSVKDMDMGVIDENLFIAEQPDEGWAF